MSAQISIDGVVKDSYQQLCTSTPCSLSRDWLFKASEYTDGDHLVQVRLDGGVGGVSEERHWLINVESDQPVTPESDADAPGPDQSTLFPRGLLDCEAEGNPIRFDHFSIGASFEGLAATAAMRRCDVPYGGEIVRANYVSYVYGDCVATSPEDEGRCTPPLEIQSWPACERALADYGTLDGPLPYDALTVRGVPAASFSADERLEVFTGSTTIVLFGHDPDVVQRAADALRREATAPPNLPSGVGADGADLPAPVTGATKGLYSCALQGGGAAP